MHRIIFAQVRQSHHITCLIIVATFVCHPHLNAVNRHTAGYVGQRLHRLLIIITEIVTQEEVTVLVITIYRHLKVRCLRSSFAANGLTLWVLLWHQCLHAQLAKLQIRLHTKQRTTSAYQTVIQRHRHVTCLQRLYNIILLSLEIQLQVLLIKTERCLCVITHIEVQLIAHFSVHAQLYLLIEVKDVVIPRTLCQCGIIYKLMFETKQQLRRTLQFHLHATWTEYLICGTDIKLHIGDVEFAFVVMFYFAYFLLPELSHLLAFAVRTVFVFCHHIGGRNLHVTNASTNHIVARQRIIFYRSIHIFWVLQIQAAGHAI